ncbi:uncharacterized protein SEPMUDRAFT_119556 [Sphaerulina musiva SO2202]|uniref:Uncharacterized protein n=1 Tax=Sphaerulina musiva (strain SO2202) TaxID=692275 RepID=M3BT21_SPHMS|nr:uncharacterized protein SEPMUDRAFT_119556 [Sphaerulina musiva SO2202]EMF09815.1 hypothetical protein SEPMUDRAFT_119556 [Sphaerulina musiva SO2202]
MASLIVVVELEFITTLWKLKPRTGSAASWIALQQQGEARKNIGVIDRSIRCPHETCYVYGGRRHSAQKLYPSRSHLDRGHCYDLESLTATSEVLIAIAGTWSTPKALFPTYRTSRCALFW